MTEIYTDHVHHTYTESLLHAAQQHLTMEGAMKVSHLGNEQREIDGRNCKEAFLDTFSQQFLTAMENMHTQYGVDAALHSQIRDALHGFTHDVVHQLGGDTPLSRMGHTAHEIITSHF